MSFKNKKYMASFFRKDLQVNKSMDDPSEISCTVHRSVFTSEDKVIAKLYRTVVDEMCDLHRLTERTVNSAISKMKRNISLSRRRDLRRFTGIDFNRPANTLGYLRCYAIPYTGLVKKAMFNFFNEPKARCTLVKENILQSESLNVISLGGGPGNDLVGFCSAVQETYNAINKMELKVVDGYSGWSSIFESIVANAKTEQKGTLSNLLKSIDVTTGFICQDLTVKAMFKNENFISNVNAADVVLMVKFLSFLQKQHRKPLVVNTAKLMHEGATLIYIDYTPTKELFDHIRGLEEVYKIHMEYEIDFNPVRFHCPTVQSVKSYVHVFQKVGTHSRSIPNSKVSNVLKVRDIETDYCENDGEDNSTSTEDDSEEDGEDTGSEDEFAKINPDGYFADSEDED